ncbi:hypothetical protein BDD12DRAFT_981341 [Trichophaea hybrida]|nr:hypothetical protein BDD12DRAFT_981341 [Trichophaea hybrida]
MVAALIHSLIPERLWLCDLPVSRLEGRVQGFIYLTTGLVIVHLPCRPISVEGFKSPEITRIVRFGFEVVVRVMWVAPYVLSEFLIRGRLRVEAPVRWNRGSRDSHYTGYILREAIGIQHVFDLDGPLPVVPLIELGEGRHVRLSVLESTTQGFGARGCYSRLLLEAFGGGSSLLLEAFGGGSSLLLETFGGGSKLLLKASGVLESIDSMTKSQQSQQEEEVLEEEGFSRRKRLPRRTMRLWREKRRF